MNKKKQCLKQVAGISFSLRGKNHVFTIIRAPLNGSAPIYPLNWVKMSLISDVTAGKLTSSDQISGNISYVRFRKVFIYLLDAVVYSFIWLTMINNISLTVRWVK